MTTVMNESKEEPKQLSESEYSGDDAEDKGEVMDEVVDRIRAKYPHLSRKKVSSMTKAWRGKKAAAIRRKAEQEELKQLRLIVSKRNREKYAAEQKAAAAPSKDGGIRRENVRPRKPLGLEKPPTDVYSAYF